MNIQSRQLGTSCPPLHIQCYSLGFVTKLPVFNFRCSRPCAITIICHVLTEVFAILNKAYSVSVVFFQLYAYILRLGVRLNQRLKVQHLRADFFVNYSPGRCLQRDILDLRSPIATPHMHFRQHDRNCWLTRFHEWTAILPMLLEPSRISKQSSSCTSK